MKNKIIVFLFSIIIFSLLIIGIIKVRENNKSNNIKISVAEVTHSVFYSPWYVAKENGYFLDEGIDIEIILTSGADKTTAAVLSKDVDIGLAGAEASFYVYNNGEKDYVKTFASLTKRDGQFLVGSCNEKDNFDVKNLISKNVLAGRVGGMPLMVFTYGLYKNGINPKDVNINSSVDFASLSGAFISGEGEYVNLFEPTALTLEKEKYGCVLSSIGRMSGEVPYTTFFSRKSYINDNKDVLRKFVKAINRGLAFVKNNSAQKISEVIKAEFPSISKEDLTLIVKRYKDNDSWWDNTYVEEDAFNTLKEIMKYNNALDKDVSFDKLVTNEFNEK
ncbi:MAG: ABC transporter substrate-binding protein [Bacilli bacterium]